MSKNNESTKTTTQPTDPKQGQSNRHKGGRKPKNQRYRDRKSNDRNQATKDSDSKRINEDNVRVGKLMRLLKADNDVTWYTRNPELLKSAASLPFATISGAPNRVTDVLTPGILRVDINPAFGMDSLYPTALNQAGKSVYSYLVHANSRNYTYEYQDLMIMIMAGAQIFAALAAGERVYGLSKYYMEQNRYFPEDLIRACGFQPKSIRENLGKIWFQLNELIARTNQIWIPNTFPVIQRWMWLNSNIFVDSTNARAQAYVFCQPRFYKYKATYSETGGGLVSVKVVGFADEEGVTWDAYYAAVSEMIDALVNDEDRGVIFGDILNAYGSEKIYSRPAFSSDYITTPVYSQEVLTQIENLTIGDGTLIQCHGLTQTPDGLSPVWQAAPSTPVVTKGYYPEAAVLNFHDGWAPTPENIAVATRLQAIGVEKTSAWVPGANAGDPPVLGSAWVPKTAGTEIVIAARLYRAYMDSNHARKVQKFTISNEQISSYSPTQEFTTNGDLMAFDWHPFMYKAAPISDPTLPYWAGGDYDNWIWLTYPEALKIHDTCVYSLFGLPIL